jgi:predicted Zn-dependent peptidase
MFKGTKKRPTTLDISKALDSVGAEFNAATSKDWTGYFVKIDSEKIELALDVLSDMVYNSKFDVKEINKERGVIIEEINMYHDNPLMYIEDVLEMLMFKGSTLGWEIAGPKEVIKTVNRQKLVDYKTKFYSPENMVVGIAGNINSKINNLVKKYF